MQVISSDPFLVLHTKLRRTAKALKRWSSRMLSQLKLQIQVVRELIYSLGVAQETRDPTVEEMQFRKLLKVRCLGLAALERCMWRQRSRITWLREYPIFPHESKFKEEKRLHSENKPKWQSYRSSEGQGGSPPRKRTLSFQNMNYTHHPMAELETEINEEVRATIMEIWTLLAS